LVANTAAGSCEVLGDGDVGHVDRADSDVGDAAALTVGRRLIAAERNVRHVQDAAFQVGDTATSAYRRDVAAHGDLFESERSGVANAGSCGLDVTALNGQLADSDDGRGKDVDHTVEVVAVDDDGPGTDALQCEVGGNVEVARLRLVFILMTSGSGVALAS